MTADGQMLNCLVMGIVNVTPDSFSDGGRFVAVDEAVARAHELAEDGAAIIDIGGESTRPGATPVSWEEEWRRIGPVLEGLHGHGLCLSVDTYHPETAERAIDAGARIVNCVYASAVPEMLRVVSRAAPEVELVAPAKCADAVMEALGASRIYLDPMIGFGTTREEDLELLRSVRELSGRGRVLVGASRKRIVRALAGEKDTSSLLGGDIAVALWAAESGADVVRVHDVKEVSQALRVYGALLKGGQGAGALASETRRTGT